MRLASFGIVGLLLAVPLAGMAGAEAEPTGFRATLDGWLDDAALGWDAIPDPLPMEVTDLETGERTIQMMPLDQVLAQMDAGLAAVPIPQQRAAHLVVGDVAHTCADPVRLCYLFSTNAASSQSSLVDVDKLVPGVKPYQTARNAYDNSPANSLAKFPVHGGNAMYVHGQYFTGGHKCVSTSGFPVNPNAGFCVEGTGLGTGTTHPDRSMYGAGSGFLYFFSTIWGCNPDCKYISFGQIRAHGVWRFCPTETDADCVPAP